MSKTVMSFVRTDLAAGRRAQSRGHMRYTRGSRTVHIVHVATAICQMQALKRISRLLLPGVGAGGGS